MRRIWTLLLILLACPAFSQTDGIPTDALRQQWEESYKLRGEVWILQDSAGKGHRQESVEKLNEMLAAYDNHPIVPSILLALGHISEDGNHLSEAESYYRRAMGYPIKSDYSGFEQQDALNALAALYERQGKYRKAAELLSSWEIASWCGNGADYSQYDRLFKVLELRLHDDSADRVLADFWSQFISGDYLMQIDSGANLDEWATRIRRLYGPADTKLRSDMGRVEVLFVRREAESNLERRRRQLAIALFGLVRRQLDYLKDLDGATVSQLVERLKDPGGNGPHSLHGRLNELFSGNGNLWREDAVVACTMRQGSKALPDLIKAADTRDNQLILYAIGAVGGKEAVDFLIKKAAAEQNSWVLKNYYYALLLTDDPEARVLVEDAAPEGSDNESQPAVWALRAYARSRR